MKKVIAVSMALMFAAGFAACNDCFAQRSVNSAQEAAMKAKEGLQDRRGQSSSQVEWLNNIINVVNMNQTAPKRDVAAENNKAIEESKGR